MNKYNVIGVMSGTSLDGLDLIHVTFTLDDKWHFNINNCETIGYDEKWKNVLSKLVEYSPKELSTIDEDYTKYLAEVINHFIKKNKRIN